MFKELRRRMVSAMGVRICSFEDLDRLEIDSVDSVCLSDSSGSHKTLSSLSGGSLSSERIADLAKRKVIKVLRFIKKLEQLHAHKKENRMTFMPFLDLIRDKEYSDVSMSMINTFIKTCRMVPKPYYLHYFIYFLYYAYYYHHVRATKDVIDDKMKKYHEISRGCIKLQLKYLHNIIKESRVKEVSL